MKGIYLVTILYVATLSIALNGSLANIPTKCPETLRNETVFVPHENDCTKFYNCYMGVKGEPVDCPNMDKDGNKLHFNPKLQVCDWPWSAGCQTSSSTSTTTSSIPTSIITPNTTTSPTPTTPTPSSPTLTTPTTSTPSSPTPTTPTTNSPTPTTSTPSSPTPTTSTPSSPTPTTPTPSSPTLTTSTTSSSSTPTTPTPSSPTPTTSTPSSPTPTTSTTSTPSSPTPTTPTPSSPTPTTSTPSSPTPTIPTTPTPSSPTTPSSDSCISDDRLHMLPHKTMCDHYYLCFNGWISPILQKCDRNLLFNSLLRVCDYPENVNCKNSSPNMDKSNPSSISPPFNSSLPIKSDPVAWICEPNGKHYKIPHEIMCDYYYWCANGIKGTESVRCESNLLFNPEIGECDYSENVNCEKRITSSPDTTVPPPTTTPTTTTPKTTIPTTTTPTTTAPTTTAPTTTTTTPTTTTPTTTIPTTTTPTTTAPTTTTTTPTTTTPTTTIPTTTTPKTTIPTTLTSTTTTSITTQTTPTEITITTPTITTETPTTRNSNEPREKCPPRGSTEEARIAHPCLCNQYYDCIDGEKILQTCPIGKHFDYVREVCDWASIVKCIRPIPTFDILISDIPIDDYNTTCAPEGRAFQHATDCSTYYLCSNGKKILKQCMEGLHFNMTIQTCDYPQKSCDLNRSLPIINLDICPPSDSVQKVYLPHECECTQYYECIHGKKVLRFCPNHLHFDRVWQICNDPIEAKCVANTISTTSTTIFTTPSTTKAIDKRIKCPPKGSTEKLRLPHLCLCNQYYECVEGDKVLRTCPNNMYFDDATEDCDWSTKVKCISQFPSHDIQINDYDINNKCSPNGRAFNHEDSCTEYYLCSKGEKVLKHCIEGLHFNVSIQMCDYPQKKCDLNTPESQPIPTVILDVCPPPGTVGKVLLPHECDCTQYYECIDGKQILRDCSYGLHYDYVHQICNVPIEAKCVDFTTTIPKSSSPTTPDSSKCYEENKETPHENDCRFYYKCSNGEKILKTCPRNLYFNSKLRVCDYPENVACNIEANIPSTPTPTKCKTITKTTNIPHETDCNLYYVCENGVSTLKKCSPNLVFNPILKVCDFPENYVCNVIREKNNIKKIDETVQNLDPSTCIGICPEEDPEYVVLLPNDDCKKFCMCSGGVAWVQSCPEPLYFDSVEKICKKKKDAVCGERLYNQDSSFTIDNDNSLRLLTDENNDNEREIYEKSLELSSCIGTCLEEDPEHAVLFPNDDCKKFCLCSNGTTYVQSCPELLYFDSVNKTCKRKKDAVCAVRSFKSSLMIDRIFDDYDSVSLSEEDYNEYELYDNPWYKRRFYNVDPSTCIGICPEEDTGYEEFLPHKDCRKFCICSKGLTYVQLCPESLYFHSVEKVCRQRRHAVCAINSFKRHHAITINSEDDDDEDDSMEFLREHNNKRRRHNYFWPHFHNFNPTTCIGLCSEIDSKYAVLYPHKDCKKFCLCNNGVTWIRSCPEYLYFDSIHKRCKRKEEAVCAVRTFNQNKVVVIDKQVNEKKRIEIQERNNEREIYDSWSTHHSHQDTSSCIGTCPNEDYDYAVLLPNWDCRKFCICSSGLTWVQSCSKPFYFDSVDKICKLKRNAICAVNSFHTNRLFTFNKMIDENNSMTSSNEEKNYNRKTRDNTWSKLYFSNHQSLNDLDPSTCIGTCPEEDPEYAVLLPNDDCKKFCICSGGVAWVQPCPEPLYFDSVQKTCKRKKDAVCGVRSYNQDSTFTIDLTVGNDNSMKILTTENNERGTYDSLDPSTCIGTCPEEDPEYAVLLPNDDCKKFCICSGGVAWVQPCPDPLYFDSVQKTCKRKKDAVCGVRLFNEDRVFMVNEK